MKNLLWLGTGDLAQRTLMHLPNHQWHTTAVQRQSRPSTFQQTLFADITQEDSLQALPKSTSHVVYSPTPAGRTDEAYRAIYDLGLKNTLQALNLDLIKRFVFISSTAVYGPDPVPQDEHSMLRPSAFNGEHLVNAEQFLQRELGDKLTVVRFSGLYGPGRERIFNMLRAQQLRINPALDNYANRIHIEDAARVCAHLLELEQAASCYVATDTTPLPQRQLYHHLCQQLQVPAPAFDSTLPYESKHFSNQRLLSSGFLFTYPNTLNGYSAVLDANTPSDKTKRACP